MCAVEKQWSMKLSFQKPSKKSYVCESILGINCWVKNWNYVIFSPDGVSLHIIDHQVITILHGEIWLLQSVFCDNIKLE